jgi:hypothetical protein
MTPTFGYLTGYLNAWTLKRYPCALKNKSGVNALKDKCVTVANQWMWVDELSLE